MGRHVIYQRIFRVVQRTLLLIVPILVIRSVHQDIMVMAVLAALTQGSLGQSPANTTSITGCYIIAGTYYDQKGTISLASSCYYE